MSHEMEMLHRGATFRAAIGCGAEIVAAAFAEAGAIQTTRAEDRAKTDRGEDDEEQSGEPVRDVKDASGPWRRDTVNVAEAENRERSGPWERPQGVAGLVHRVGRTG